VKTAFTGSFLRDVRKLPDDAVREQVRDAILLVEAAPDLRSVANLKKLSGGGSYYRIRLGDYRIGIRVDEDVVSFIRVLPRKDIYRYFP
jgi:mRNA interferase RelE/StbE